MNFLNKLAFNAGVIANKISNRLLLPLAVKDLTDKVCSAIIINDKEVMDYVMKNIVTEDTIDTILNKKFRR